MKVSLAATVEPGQTFLRHEDFYCVDASLGLFVIAEGQGATGGVVSRTLVRALRQFIVEHQSDRAEASHDSQPKSMPGYRLQVGLIVARGATTDGNEQSSEGVVAMCALLFEGDRVAIARFGGCGVFRLRGTKFEELRDREPSSLALSIHDVEVDHDDHWLLSTSGMPAELTEPESRLVIDASHHSERVAEKPLITVASGGPAPLNLLIVGTASV